MATLEKIRSRSVLLLIIIGAALLAFIIGDFFTSGRTMFGTGTTIAKVGSQKIDVQDFQRKVQEATQQAQGRKYDSAVLQQQVLDQMIAEALFNQEAKDLGLKVTDAELRAVMVGDNSAYVNQRVQQETGVESARMLHDMAYNPAKYGLQQEQAAQLTTYWVNLESEIEKMLLQQKFQNLFAGTLVANDLDARAIYDENNATSHMLYAKKDYSSLPDDKYPVSDADLQAAYDKEKNRYKLDEESRAVNFINVDIQPSPADVKAAETKVADALKALKEKPEATGLEGMNEFVVDRQKYTAKKMEDKPNLKAFTDSAAIGSAVILQHHMNDYNLVKLLARPVEIDGATIDFLAIQGSKGQIDSLTAALNSGASFDSISALPMVANKQKDIEISLVDPQYSSVREIIEGATVGQFFAPDTVKEGGRIFRVTKRDAPSPVYDIVSASYTIEPSAATVNTLQANLQRFINTNNTAEKFVKNAEAAGYNQFPAIISNSTPQLSVIPDSHAAVAWAMEDAKKGQVSQIFGDEQTGRFIVVAVSDIYDDGFLPVRDENVKNQLTTKVRNNHKADALIKQYKGKANDVNGYASIMGATVDTAAVVFGQQMIPGLGNDGKLQGLVADSKVGKLVGPVQGENGVLVFQVTSIDNEGRPYSREEGMARYMQQRGAQRMGNNLNRILIGNKKVTNNINKFYK